MRVGAVRERVSIGRRRLRGREFRAVSQRTGKERFLTFTGAGGRFDVDDGVVAGVHGRGGQEAMIGGFIHILRHICILVCRLVGRMWREKHLQDLVNRGERSVTTAQVCHSFNGSS